jgi:quercetin dioxygenase-like cupin family protein
MSIIPDVMVSACAAYTLLLENERVRVMEVRLEPGGVALMHNHPNDHVVYVQNAARVELRFADGSDTTLDLSAGQALWLKAGAHETHNVGTTEVRNLVVEIKK